MSKEQKDTMPVDSPATNDTWEQLSRQQLQCIKEWDGRRLDLELSRICPRLRGRIHEPVHSIRNLFSNWEDLVRRMAAGWGPSGTYPISAYPNDLENRDLLETALSELSEETLQALRPLVEQLDDILYAHTMPDPEGELRPWVHPPDENDAAEWWSRKPRVQPWS